MLPAEVVKRHEDRNHRFMVRSRLTMGVREPRASSHVQLSRKIQRLTLMGHIRPSSGLLRCHTSPIDRGHHSAKRFACDALCPKCSTAPWLLHLLRQWRAGHKTESEFQVWQEGFHPQALMNDAVMEQKLEYIHNNPVKRGLVAAPEHWRYSSAHEWCSEVEPLLRCDPWR